MFEHRRRLPGLVALEAVICEQARVALELRNRPYVEAFRGAVAGGFDEAVAAGRPFLTSPPWWYEPLAGLLAVELAMDQVESALILMRSHRSTGREDGGLLLYHLHHWLIEMLALIEKSLYLTRRVYRTLVRRLNPDFYKEREQKVTTRLKALRKQYANVRDPLVHALPGWLGALEEDRLWEAHLLVNATVADVLDAHYDNIGSRRAKWHDENRQRTAVVLATINATFRRTAADATTVLT